MTIQGFEVLYTMLGIISTLLLGLLGWIGNRVHNRLDEIAQSLGSIEKDLRGDLTSLDRRVSRIEGQHEIERLNGNKRKDD